MAPGHGQEPTRAARARLQGRLTRRGLAPSAGLLRRGALVGVSAAVGTVLVGSTVKAAMRFAASRSLAGVVPASIASLTEGVLRIMAITKLKTIAITLMGAGVVAAGATGLAFQGPGGRAEAEQTEGGPQQKGRELDAAPKSPFELDRDSTTGRPEAQSPHDANDELELLKVQLEKKRAAVRRAEAHIDLAKALVARNTRLIARDKNYVSKEEQIKAESEVAIASAERDVQQAEAREVEERIRQAMRRQSNPEGLTGRSGPSASPASPAAPGAEVEGDGSEAGSAHRGRRGPGTRESAPRAFLGDWMTGDARWTGRGRIRNPPLRSRTMRSAMRPDGAGDSRCASAARR